jgi:hypothetical protein
MKKSILSIMKKINLLVLMVVGALAVTSCSTYKHSYRLSTVPQSTIGVTPTIVDIVADFDRQVTGSSDKKTSSIQDAKDNAYYNAITGNKIDVLVDPIYRIQVRKGVFRTTARAEVTGFAGSFENSRSLLEDQQNQYDVKLAALKKLISIKEIQDEERNSVIISSGQGGTTTTVNSAPSYVQQFNSLFSNSPINFGNGATAPAAAAAAPAKKKGLFAKLLGK